MAQRFALYYAPAVTSPLWERAAIWLGRDAANGSLYDGAVAGIPRDRLLNVTQSAGRYGFHATIKAPMALAEGKSETQLRDALAAFCDNREAIDLGPLRVSNHFGVLALTPVNPTAAQEFAAELVEHFEPFRAPLTARDRARRLPGLSPVHVELLDRYGYPHVLDQFKFHMTLSDRLPSDELEEMAVAAEQWFAPVLATPMRLDRMSIFIEPDNGLAFRRHTDCEFTG
ncbi:MULTISPECIES: DUF1045 domain-containing protein [unclassified Devosia]|uniref:DUF1045 domain-containing protein n=1 Tax=unclassified Devosia TaxID=196773 RepID=UPI00145EED62|nr:MULTISPECIES: DUF1045 domain-containing protein [unclassified Devosia]MBJ6989076.1 DUF1045 domain-containing protein [Devosia sp. MC521]QMW62919.1 DUF1045 domain-containing protein [Devosia sp. MC521]